MGKRTKKSKQLRLTIRKLGQKIESLVSENVILKRKMKRINNEQSPKI